MTMTNVCHFWHRGDKRHFTIVDFQDMGHVFCEVMLEYHKTQYSKKWVPDKLLAVTKQLYMVVCQSVSLYSLAFQKNWPTVTKFSMQFPLDKGWMGSDKRPTFKCYRARRSLHIILWFLYKVVMWSNCYWLLDMHLIMCYFWFRY